MKFLRLLAITLVLAALAAAGALAWWLNRALLMAALGEPNVSPEGRFYPDTYAYSKGASDLAVLKRAHRAMQTRLTAAWAERASDTPLRSPEEALTLASIVEKETGVPADRGKVAGVFINRLKLGMPLQTDPSVIYGMGASCDGNDGAGKSTHIDAVATRLRAPGSPVLCTREPGGTELAERLRELVLHATMDPLTEALIVFAARRDHLQRVIVPALARGETVLCDRFTDASFAYQGGGRGFDAGVLAQLEQWVQQGLQPDLTIWFDLSAELGAQRRAAARAPDRFEQEDMAFF